MAMVTRTFEYTPDKPDFVGATNEQTFQVDHDGDVWVHERYGDDCTMIQRPALELFLRRYDEMVALAQNDEETN